MSWFWVQVKLLLSSKQARLIVSVTLLVSLFIASVGLYLYSDYRENVDRELNRPHIELLQINLDVTNRAFRIYDEHAAKLSFLPEVVAYVTASRENKGEAAAKLREQLIPDSLLDEIHSVYIVDTERRRLASSNADGDWDIESFPDQSWVAGFDSMSKKPLLVNRRTMGRPGDEQQVETELISIYRPILDGHETVGAVVVNLDYDRFFTTIYSQVKNPQYIYNLNHELIYPKQNRLFPAEDLEAAIRTLGVRPFGEVRLDGRSYLANQMFSDVTGWRWVSFVPLDDLLSNARLVRSIVILLSVASILVGCGAVWYYSYTAFRPLKRIRRMLVAGAGAGHAAEAPVSGADLHDVEQYIRKLSREYSTIAAVAQLSLPELRAKYVPDVLFRRIGAKEMSEKWGAYFRDWSDEPLFGAMISIDGYDEWGAGYSEEDQLLFKYALANLVGECLQARWRNIIVPLDKENMFALLQPKKPLPHAEPHLQSDFEHTISAAAAYLQIRISVGIGGGCDSVIELHRSYAEANEALLHRLYEGYGRAIRYGSGLASEPAEGSEDGRLDELLGAIESADAQRYIEAIRQWADGVRADRRKPEEVYAFAHELIEAVCDGLARKQLPPPPILHDYTEHRLRMLDLEDIVHLLTQIAEWMESALKERIGKKEYNLVQRMIRYMEEHMHENIGLQEIADAFQLSTSTMNNMFKQETGYSTYEFLTKLRIDKSAELLTTSNLRVAEIAAMVGYQNENSFIRSFRRSKSVTPGKYREMHQTV